MSVCDSVGPAELCVAFLEVGGHPYCAFACRLPAVVVSVVAAPVVGNDYHEPFFVVVLFAVFYRFPNVAQQRVGGRYAPVAVFAVAFDVEGVVGVPQVDPVEVGGIGAYVLGGLGAHVGVDVEDVEVARFVGEVGLVVVVAVEHVVNLEVACLGLAFAQQYGAVVGPRGVDGGGNWARLVLGNAEDGGVVVVLLYVAVAAHVVLVHPRAGDYVGVAYGGDGGRFAVHAHVAAAVCAGVAAFFGNVHYCVGFEALYAVGRNAVDDDEQGFAGFCFGANECRCEEQQRDDGFFHGVLIVFCCLPQS